MQPFGVQPAQPQQVPAPAAQLSVAQPDHGAIRELEQIGRAYQPGQTQYKFNHLFLDVVAPHLSKEKPPVVDDLAWRAAVAKAEASEDPVWPSLYSGFGDLIVKRTAQEAALDENKAFLSQLRASANKLLLRQTAVVDKRVEQLQSNHAHLTNRLLKVMRHVDALEARFAHSMGLLPREAQAASATRHVEVDARLSEAERALGSGAAGGLQAQVEGLVSEAHMRMGAPPRRVEGDVDEASKEQIAAVLQQHTDAIARLQEVLAKDIRDIQIMRQGPEGAGDAALLTVTREVVAMRQ